MRLFVIMNGWLAIIAGIALVVMTVLSVSSYRDAIRLETDGVWITGEIINQRIKTSDDSDTYYASFRYTVDNSLYTAERNVGRTYYNQHLIGDIVDIHYWADGPRLFEYTQGQTRESAQLLQLVALLIGVAGLTALWWYGGRTNRAVLARRRGIRTVATITLIHERKKSGRKTGRGYMRFTTKDGLTGESLDHSIHKLRALGSGTQIVVFQRRTDVWWEGDIGPRRRHASQLPKVSLD